MSHDCSFKRENARRRLARTGGHARLAYYDGTACKQCCQLRRKAFCGRRWSSGAADLRMVVSPSSCAPPPPPPPPRMKQEERSSARYRGVCSSNDRLAGGHLNSPNVVLDSAMRMWLFALLVGGAMALLPPNTRRLRLPTLNAGAASMLKKQGSWGCISDCGACCYLEQKECVSVTSPELLL
jgi:hypothetical protein